MCVAWCTLQLRENLRSAFEVKAAQKEGREVTTTGARQTVITRVHDAVQAIALCHNVTPVYDLPDSETEILLLTPEERASRTVTYQASSPDEVCSYKHATQRLIFNVYYSTLDRTVVGNNFLLITKLFYRGLHFFFTSHLFQLIDCIMKSLF